MRRRTFAANSWYLYLAAATACITSRALAATFNSVSSPNLDLKEVGRVAIVGDFDAISLYQYEGQTEDSFSSNGSQSLLARLPNGAFAPLEGADGTISTMCSWVLQNGSTPGVVVGGNFTSLGGAQTQGLALFNPNTSTVTPLPGLNGQVSSLYCDSPSGLVYVGGSFTASNSSNAMSLSEDHTLQPLSFGGFNGAVNSITKASSGNIVFGGDFDGLGNTTTPKERDSQTIPIGSGNVTATGSTTQTGFSDPSNIICKTGATDGSGNSWLLADGATGSWQANFEFGFVPTKVRLYNTQQDGRGTKTWRFTALPDGGILRMNYTDPSSGQTMFCDQTCPLPQNNVSAQDFSLVAPNVGMNGFRIDISAFYGAGGGLSGIEMFQDDIYSYAINEFNEPQCDGVSTGATSTQTGPWSTTPSGMSTSEYLTASLTGSPVDPSSASVVFKPDIKQSGNYTVTVFTPGCISDNTCSTRGRVNLTGTLATDSSSGSEPLSSQVTQTNNFDKYDQVYYGFVDATSSSFQPSVTLTPATGQTGPLTIVAQRVRFELQTTTGGLNGLYEFNPNEASVNTDFSTSAIDRAGESLDAGATVTALAVEGENVYVGGNFSTSDFANIFSVGSENASSLAEGGLNGGVLSIVQNGSTLYIGGNFSGTQDNTTQGLHGVAAYNTQSNAWQALGQGVNGQVSYIVPLALNLTGNQPEQVISVNGNFDTVLAFGSNASFSANNIAIWVPSRNNWLQNLDMNSIAISGQLTATTDVVGNSPLFAGAVSSQALSASGAVGLEDSSGLNLLSLGARIQPIQQDDNTTSVQKRATAAINGQNVTGVVTGFIYEENNLNITILAGQFSAAGSDGSTVNNLVFINGSNNGAVTGLPAGLSTDSTFLAVGTTSTSLFAGGTVTGRVNNDDVNGLIVYDLATSSYAQTQPPALEGTSVSVNAIAPQPSGSDVYVGGSFESAGSFNCPSLCNYDTAVSQWTAAGSGLGGTVAAMIWVSNTRMIVAGNLTANNTATSVVGYNSKNNVFETSIPGADTLPGAVTALCAGSSDGSQFWVAGQGSNGSAFIEKYDGKQFQPVGQLLGEGSVIRGLQIFMLTKDHGGASLLSDRQALLVTGQLSVPGFGNASSALYNGTAFTPFALSVTSDNQPGSLSQVFVENPGNVFKGSNKNLAVGYVVLIALAIALALTFLIVVAGVIAERIRRKREGYTTIPSSMFDKGGQMSRIPPEHLFGSMGPNQRGGPL